jgi:hypothetical protein
MTEYVLVGLVDAEKASTHKIPVGIATPASSYDGQLCVAVDADPLVGTESVLLDDLTLPDTARRLPDLNAAIAFGAMLHAMDKRMRPPFNPVVGEAYDGQLVALVLPPKPEKSDRFVRTAALRYGITVTRLQAVA